MNRGEVSGQEDGSASDVLEFGSEPSRRRTGRLPWPRRWPGWVALAVLAAGLGAAVVVCRDNPPGGAVRGRPPAVRVIDAGR